MTETTRSRNGRFMRDPFRLKGKVLIATTGRADRDLLGAVAKAGGRKYVLRDPGYFAWLQGDPLAAIMVLGDTYNALLCAAGGHKNGIPVIHIHGGEITMGSYDDSMRHAISKLACLHFVVGDEERDRLIRMGEQPASVHVVGSIGAELASKVPRKMNTERPFYLFTWHNPTWADEDAGEIIKAFDDLKANVLVTGTNDDPGSKDVRKKLAQWRKANPDRVTFAQDMGMADYHKAMSECIAVVGNSSSGIFEAPAMGVPVVNIGERQAGRRHGLSCAFNTIRGALELAKMNIRQLEAETTRKFYLRDHGNRSTIAEIVRIINQSLPLNPRKAFYDHEPEPYEPYYWDYQGDA